VNGSACVAANGALRANQSDIDVASTARNSNLVDCVAAFHTGRLRSIVTITPQSARHQLARLPRSREYVLQPAPHSDSL
jgi:hypothetical protein